jgi:DNA repair protein RecN (Recombination protein N)
MASHQTNKLYLKSISLKNFATFSDQIINFTCDFNAIIGETGSGKSLILDAMQLILGGRADKKIIRKGAEFATIEAFFECNDPSAITFFEEIGFPIEDNEIIIKRVIYTNDKNKNFLNFQACNLQTLLSFSKRFIDIVGQFENQKLLMPTYQLILLDNFSNNKELLDIFKENFFLLKNKEDYLEKLIKNKSDQAQREDYLKFQIGELDSLNPSSADEKNLILLKEQFLNLEELNKFKMQMEELFNGESGLYNILNIIEKNIRSNKILGKLSTLDKFYLAKDLISESYYEIEKHSSAEFDENEINEIIDRLDCYQKLKRKFSTDAEGLEHLLNQFKVELSNFQNNDEQISNLNLEIEKLKTKCFELAEKLHQTRLKNATLLSQSLTEVVQQLNMKGATIKVDIKRTSTLNQTGFSDVDFIAETNPGEGFYKVKDIASGGELSRILLAFRKVLTAQDSISIFFFDEIDTGIGGETALKIGNTLFTVSENSQVIAITHLPQIAKFAKHLIHVQKDIFEQEEGVKRTQSRVIEVSSNDRQAYIEMMAPIN